MLAGSSSVSHLGIRVAVLGDWVPSQLSDLLALQRAEEPETPAAVIGWANVEQAPDPSDSAFDFAISTTELKWPGWICEPLLRDVLFVAVAKQSQLLIYREVPCHEVRKQRFICAQSTTDEPWRSTMDEICQAAPSRHEQTVSTFDMAITLVAAGYGVTIAPSARLAGYVGIATRPIAETPEIVIGHLVYPCGALTEPQARFFLRARSTFRCVSNPQSGW